MSRDAILDLLHAVQRGDLAADEAFEQLARFPFVDTPHARVDTQRSLRQGLPEVVFGPGKTVEQIVEVVSVLAEAGESALVTRVSAAVAEAVQSSLPGSEYDADVIVYATGFRANEFLWPMDIRGRGNRSLAERWGDEAAAYLGITVPGFPNFFLMYGPGTNLAFGGSLIFNGECQMRYIMESIRLLLESDSSTMECTENAFADYQRRFRDQHARMIWEHDSIDHSFYRNDRGKCTLLWPWKILEMWQRTRSVVAEDYTLGQAPGSRR